MSLSSSIRILPSLLFPDPRQMELHAKQYQAVVDLVHVDFADGLFVPAVLPSINQVVRLRTNLRFEAHLMVMQPEPWVSQALTDSRFITIVLHQESRGNLTELLQKIKKSGRRTGLAVKPTTSLDTVEPYLEYIDQLLILGVEPGRNGAPYIPTTVDKVKQASQRFSDLLIECDGGVSTQNIKALTLAGARQFAVGSYFHRTPIQTGLRALRSNIDN